jgi:alkylhydroperoxidase/carboxymuconolactone decarboxylase family protein YurZ
MSSQDGTFRRMEAEGARGYFAPIATSPLARPLLDTLSLHETWERSGLSPREHFLAHVGLMSGLNRPHEFREHLRGALANGVTPEDLVDVFCHTKLYAGMPAAVDAMMLLLEVLVK